MVFRDYKGTPSLNKNTPGARGVGGLGFTDIWGLGRSKEKNTRLRSRSRVQGRTGYDPPERLFSP